MAGQQLQQSNLEQTLQFLQLVAVIIAILGAIGPIAIAALLWKFSQSFATKKELDGLGGRVTAYETFAVQTRDRADDAHERIDKSEGEIRTQFAWIRRDLDRLLDQKQTRDV